MPQVLDYIHKGWDVLTRTMNSCETIIDKHAGVHSMLYLPVGYPENEAMKEVTERCKVELAHLPQKVTAIGSLDTSHGFRQGTLYLPNPYVVPGGFLNEQYGWDSYFIIVGLLRDGRYDMAKGMVENFFFEIDNYGDILNANRSYFMTRSQPPFLSSMVLLVYEATPDATAKETWLKKAYPYIERDYNMWTSGDKLAGDTGLSRYFDYGHGPVPEVADGHDPYYRDVFRYIQASNEKDDYLAESGKSAAKLIGPEFTMEVCEKRDGEKPTCGTSSPMQYTADYYKGDRAMRESGFDISFRFGDFSGKTHHFAAVCLNSLLYKAETDMQKVSEILKNGQAQTWAGRAAKRKQLVDKYLWDAQRGRYFDWDFTLGKRSTYDYITTFYPLWVGLASQQQAKQVMSHLDVFERAGGMSMSPYTTGVQWDQPYGWAPTMMIGVGGMRRYGYKNEADRVSAKWVNTIARNFAKDGTIREKYDVVQSSSEFQAKAGYSENVVGFGWTNASALQFAYDLGWVTKAAAN
ncbi:trehalase family glycosidase [Candidatus Korobacter versatilis]|nr:trehalase family glycosidase [Candidatus Koribacter versatilis]